MPWEIGYSAENKIIYITSKGQYTYKDIVEQTTKALELAKEHKIYLFLSDISEITSIPSIIEIFQIPSLYDDLGADRTNKLAVIVPKSPGNPEDYEFFETICQNRGRNARLFQDKQDAIQWLQSR